MTAKHIVMYIRAGCEDSEAARKFLKQHHLHFEELNIDENPEALRFVMRVNEGKKRTSTFEVDCRIFHCSPFDPQKLFRQMGLPPSTTGEHALPLPAERSGILKKRASPEKCCGNARRHAHGN